MIVRAARFAAYAIPCGIAVSWGLVKAMELIAGCAIQGAPLVTFALAGACFGTIFGALASEEL